MEHLTIGQMAKLNQVSEQTLRLYDKMGLFSPSIRKDNGYRYYDIKQSSTLDTIQYLKSIGFGLKEIKTIIDQNAQIELKQILSTRKIEIQSQLDECQSQITAINRALKSFESYELAPPTGTILIERIEQRKMHSVETNKNFYVFGMDTYEKLLRELKLDLIANHIPKVYFCSAGSTIKKEKLMNREFVSTELFVFLDDNIDDRSVKTIPAGNYICIYCDSFDKELEYIGVLIEYIEQHGYTICGDYICEVIAELPVFSQKKRSMFLRLQVPIIFC